MYLQYISGLKTLNQINGYQHLSISDIELLKRAIKESQASSHFETSKRFNSYTIRDPEKIQTEKKF
jgi:hypothetical protein